MGEMSLKQKMSACRGKIGFALMLYAFGLLNFVQGNLEFYGNEIKLRTNTQASSSARVFIDVEVIPGYGKLKEFLIYNHDSTLPIDIQIWTEFDIYNYILKWQKRVNFDQGTNRNYTFTVDEDVDITDKEHIGFTTPLSEENIPVSFDFKEEYPHPTMYKSLESGTTLDIGTSYRFSANRYPAIFSMGIKIATLFSDQQYYGNEMKLPNSQQSEGAKRTWIDKSIQLDAGYLLSYHIFVKKVQDSNTVRLQIWSQKDPTSPIYKLTWEKRVKLSQGENRLYDFVLTPGEQFQVDGTSYIGWTFENDFGPIGYNFDVNHKTIKSDPIGGDSYPRVGQNMTLDETTLPYEFKVGVKIGPPMVRNNMEGPGTTSGTTSLDQSQTTARGITSNPKPKPQPSNSTKHGLTVLCLVLVLMNVVEMF